jgi:cytochrome d ubiquinol oxidase subunit II
MYDSINLLQPDGWLPLVFAFVMALAILIYVVLDGYDLGVGILLGSTKLRSEKDEMIASIGPFWDANETWLVLGVGVLLVAFPKAHGLILGSLYLPVVLMLVGLALRGVAFDFRTKANERQQPWWDKVFFAGSLLAAWCQGYMLGHTITGFSDSHWSYLFSVLIGFCLPAFYCLLGAGWLLMKTDKVLQLKAVKWAMASLWLVIVGIMAISITTPWVSERIFDKWFSFPNIVMLLPIPLMTATLIFVIARTLKRLPVRLAQNNFYGIGVPFACTVGIFLLASYGLGYSLFPWLAIDQLSIWQAASATEALRVIFYGVLVVVPIILVYTAYTYRVFWGKSSTLHY